MYQTAYRAQEYRQQDIMGASPAHLIVMVYDLAIKSCELKDAERATKAVRGLRDVLNFDYPEVSLGLYRLYEWCLDCIGRGDYTSAVNTLRELRDAWHQTEIRGAQLGKSAYNAARIG